MRLRQIVCVVVAAAVLLQGCTVVDAASGESGADVSRVAVGEKRAAVEEAVGAPLREWVSAQGVVFALYEIDAGRPGSPGNAVAFGLLDVATAGLWEVFTSKEDMRGLHRPREYRRVVIAYEEDTIVGLFDEFAELPGDGRSEQETLVLP